MEPDIVLLSSYPQEISRTGSDYLEVRFYVSLPPDAPLSPVRRTDFVVPGDTLRTILEEDAGVIVALVQEGVPRPPTSWAHWMPIAIAGGVVSAVVTSVLLVVLAVCGVYCLKRRWAPGQSNVAMLPGL